MLAQHTLSVLRQLIAAHKENITVAFNQTRRLSGPEMKADEDALLAIKQLRDYTPMNASYSTERLGALEAAHIQAE